MSDGPGQDPDFSSVFADFRFADSDAENPVQ